MLRICELRKTKSSRRYIIKNDLKVAKDDSKKETRFCEEGGVRVSNEETEQKNAQHQSKNIVNKITKKKDSKKTFNLHDKPTPY